MNICKENLEASVNFKLDSNFLGKLCMVKENMTEFLKLMEISFPFKRTFNLAVCFT